MTVAGETIVRLPEAVRRVDGAKGAVLFRVDNSFWMKLNDSGALFINRVNGERNVDAIIDDLCREHGFPREIIAEWAQKFFTTLLDKHLLEDVAAPAAPVIADEAPRLDIIYLHVTGRCNFACPYCYASAAAEGPELDLEVCRRAILRARELGATKLAISGGEPLLYDDLEEVLRLGREAGLITQVLTNGSLLTPERAPSLTRNLDLLQVSIDGWNDETNSLTRGKGSFEKIKAAIQTVRDIGFDQVAAAVTPYHLSDDDLEAVLRMAPDLGIRLLRFNQLIPVGKASELEERRYSGEAAMHLANTVYSRYYQIQRERSKDGQPAQFGVRVAGDPGADVASMTRKLSCGTGISTLSVAGDGTVYPCAALHREEFGLGNINEEDLGDIHARSVERHRHLLVDHDPECRDCDVRHYCGGGCRAVTYAAYGRLEGKSPQCEALKSRVTNIFRQTVS